jgi:hypothetical protein
VFEIFGLPFLHGMGLLVAGGVLLVLILAWLGVDFMVANPHIVCPHCQVKGHVRTRQDEHKAGVSGGKATGAILTGGVSLLVTGLSRKEPVTVCFCGHCGSTWTVG